MGNKKIKFINNLLKFLENKLFKINKFIIKYIKKIKI